MSKKVSAVPDSASDGEKQVAPIPVDAVVRAYLEKQLADLQHTLAHKEEDMKKAEMSMMAQINRVMGQHEGEIESLKRQIAAIRQTLNPQPAEATPAAA
jgi:predicted  nucleic acid-binding Zn-ribbon protein